ncbi:MAG: DUF3352 domain-containing protein [Cyanobacteria bacterium J06638_22]
MPEKKTLKPLLIVLSGTAIALGLGAYLGYRLSRGTGFVGGTGLTTGAEVVPQDAVMTLTVSTDAQQWQQLRSLGTDESRSQLDSQLVEWRDRFLTANGLDYEQDIQPWVGEAVTLVVLPRPASASAEPEPAPEPEAEATEDESAAEPESADEGFTLPENFVDPRDPLPRVVVLPIANPLQAQERLTRALEESGSAVQTRDYEGFSIQEVDGAGDEDYVATVLDEQYVVVSPQASAIEQVIDAYRGDALTDVSGYRQAIADVSTEQPFLQMYLNAPAARSEVESRSIEPVPLVGMTPLQRNQGIAASLSLDSQQMQVRGVNWLPEDSDLRYPGANNGGDLANLLPTDTRLLVTTTNLQRIWDSYRQDSGVNPQNPLNPNTFEAGISSLTGLDWNQDLLAWMDGEVGLAMMQPTVAEPEAQVGFVLMVQTSNRTAAEQALESLDATMRDRYQFEVNNGEVDETPVTIWQSPFGSLTLTHGWVTDNTVFLAVGSETTSLLLPEPEISLGDTDAFALTKAEDFNAYNGRFYLDLGRAQENPDFLPTPELPDRAGAIASAVQQIGVTSAVRSDRSTRFEIVIQVAQEGEVQPLPPPGAIPAPATEPEGDSFIE